MAFTQTLAPSAIWFEPSKTTEAAPAVPWLDPTIKRPTMAFPPVCASCRIPASMRMVPEIVLLPLHESVRSPSARIIPPVPAKRAVHDDLAGALHPQ